MDKNKLNHYRKKLLRERKEAIDTIDAENDNGANNQFQDYYSELSVYDNHPADIASETYETEMRLNLKSHEKRILNEIDNALSKFNNGTYGKCEKCGLEIGEDRLEI